MRDRGLPLLDWGDALRAARRRRLRLRRAAVGIGVGALLIVATIVVPPRPHLVWNGSASMTTGLYAVGHVRPVMRGDTVIVRLPELIAQFAARRHYLPANVPLVKRVGAVAGDRICAVGSVITIDGRPVATRHSRDQLGRPLPWWRGCRLLRDGRVFLLASAPDSFDGRYFGPVEGSTILGTARLLWAR
ncbi:S26 family signal peptidase [Sphingomonas adhaesiva]|uniref:S26 family signal peptidase n=1 Tax=Sphingomonas adhaesiva TaxID=28212 RepID=UPI002FF7FF63